jgi:preprotein translocase subunit SecA
VIYAERRKVLEGADLHEQIRHFIDDVVDGYVKAATEEGFGEDWDVKQLLSALASIYPVGLTAEDLIEEVGGAGQLTAPRLAEELRSDAQYAYDRREKAVGEEGMRELERRVVLSVLDRKWREHLYEMDYLQEGISLRAMAQRDPLVEYQREGYQLFQAMTEAIKEESVGYLFNLEVQVQAPAEQVEAPLVVAKGLQAPTRAALTYSAPTEDGDVDVHSEPTGAPARGETPSSSSSGSGPDMTKAASKPPSKARRRRDRRR